MRIRQFIYTFSLATFFVGCNTFSFVQQTQNVPLFTDKNQLQVKTTIAPCAIDLQLAYSPINHLGVLINAQKAFNYFKPEIACGYYYSLNEKYVAEIYGGFSTSVLKADYTHQSQEISERYTKTHYITEIKENNYFIQPNIGIHFNKYISLAISCKINYWEIPINNYYEHYETWDVGSSRTRPLNSGVNDSLQLPNTKQITYEPAITFKIGGKRVKGMVQVGYSIADSKTTFRINPYAFCPVYFRLGLNLTFGLKKKE